MCKNQDCKEFKSIFCVWITTFNEFYDQIYYKRRTKLASCIYKTAKISQTVFSQKTSQNSFEKALIGLSCINPLKKMELFLNYIILSQSTEVIYTQLSLLCLFYEFSSPTKENPRTTIRFLNQRWLCVDAIFLECWNLFNELFRLNFVYIIKLFYIFSHN